MRTLIALTISIVTLLSAVQPVRALTPAHLWSQRFGGAGTDVGYSVAVDASGNVFATGYFNGTVNFGGSNLVSAGGTDVFVAKYNAAGVHQWSQRFGSTLADLGYSVAVDVDSVLVTGYFNGTVNFGSGNLVSAGVRDIFVAKYGADGVNQWSRRFGSTGDDEGKSVAVDASGNVFATGYFNGTVNFGGVNLVSAGVNDVFLAKYDGAGVHQWSQRFGSTSFDQGRSLAVDASGNVFATGTFRVTVNFGGVNLVGVGAADDVFLAKYNAAGVHQWSQRFGGANNDQGSSIAVDASGNVFATGFFGQTVNFGGSNLVSAGNDDIFIAKYDGAGVHQWSQRFGSTESDRGNAIAVEASGNVVATGNFVGTVNFGGGNMVAAGTNDIFVARYNAAGVHQWSQRFGSTGGDAGGNGVAVAPSGDVFVTGTYSGSVDFGGGNLVSVAFDIFVAKYAREAARPVISAITDVGNDQGRRVRIAFTRSGHDDAIAPTPVVRYEAYLRDSPTPFAVVSPIAAHGPGQVLVDGWVEVASISAHAEPTYLIDAPTDADSTLALGQYYSAFYIRAATATPAVFFDSPIDSGYSKDNLAPGVPDNFIYSAGDLTWDESTAADFDYFTVYGSNTDNFGTATVVDYSVTPELDVNASPYAFYYVTATDFSGNEGKPAKVNAVTGVGGTPSKYVLSVSNYPNPFNPRTTVSYTIPSRGSVTVSVYDARGAHVATLFNGERGPGAYTIEWDGLANGSAVSSGVYFARIEHASGIRSKKMVLLK